MNASNSSKLRNGRRFIAIAAVFTVVGPLIGAVVMALLTSIVAAINEIGPAGPVEALRLMLGGIAVMTLVALPFAYSFGLASALGVGLVVAFAERRGPGLTLPVALIGAVLVGGIAIVMALGLVPPAGRAVWLGGLALAHLIGAVLCTMLARRLLGRN